VGREAADDAAVYQVSPDLAIVQTVDYITPVVDDPYTFGAVAAANAISDIYAMGARPLFALNLVNFPVDVLPMETLGEILRGGAEKAAEAGVVIGGGHSIEDEEPKYGMTVTGVAHPEAIVRNSGAKPGDVLVLTKPLGIGIISTALRNGKASEEAVAEAVRVMTALNKGASEAMVEVGVHAATDITGFGLLGHLREMISASGVGARIRVKDVPTIDAVWPLAEDLIAPNGTLRNRESLREVVEWGEGVDIPTQLVLCDAQTSGGLLIAVAPEQREALVAALRQQGTLAAAVVGDVVEGAGRIWVEG
jgi:selenide,water dikinase